MQNETVSSQRLPGHLLASIGLSLLGTFALQWMLLYAYGAFELITALHPFGIFYADVFLHPHSIRLLPLGAIIGGVLVAASWFLLNRSFSKADLKRISLILLAIGAAASIFFIAVSLRASDLHGGGALGARTAAGTKMLHPYIPFGALGFAALNEATLLILLFYYLVKRQTEALESAVWKQ